MKTIYIAGPMRGYENYNFEAFFQAQERLEEDGFKVINPAEMDIEHDCDPSMFPKDFDWSEAPDDIPISVFVLRDVKALTECTHIYLLRGWEQSVGATAEKAIAEWLKLDAIYEVK